MASFLIDWLGISTSDQARSESLTNRIKSVAEFFSDALRSVEHLDVPRRIAEACPWWVAATGEAVAEVAPPVKFVAELLKSFTEIRDPDKLACLACTTAFQRAAELSFAWVGAPPSPRLGQAWRPYTALTIAESSSFKDLSIESPWNHPFVKSAEQVMMAAAAHAGYDEAGQRRLLHEVRMRFPGELRRLVSHPDTRERYAVVADWFRFEDRENRVRDALRMHADYQRRLFEESPVFGEEPFSLSKIYVDTECGVLTWGEIIRDDETRPTSTTITTYGTEARGKGLLDPFDDEHGGRHDLLQAVMSTIGDLNFRDAIVIQGPAGSGKSSFTLRLAVELLRQGLIPIRVRLRDIGHTIRNIDEAVPLALRFCGDDERSGQSPPVPPEELFLGGRLFDHRVPFGSALICPYVMIFDGWDEVSVSAQRGFFEQFDYILNQIRDRFLTRPNRPIVRVVLTGRPSDAVARSSFMRRATKVLTIRAMNPAALQRQVDHLGSCLATSYSIGSLVNRFRPVVTAYANGFNAALLDGATAESSVTLDVLGLPLLAHLAVRLLLEWPEESVANVVESRTTLYRLLTDYTCEAGRYGKDVAEARLRGGKLRTLLQQTATSMTVYGHDSIPYDELEQRLEILDKSLLDEVREVTNDNPVSALLINFFFKGGHKELGAEFTHKSFREYLAAESIVEGLKAYGREVDTSLTERPLREYWRDFPDTDPRYAFSRRLGRLLGAQWISPDVATHLQNLLQWEIDRGRRTTPGATRGLVTRPLTGKQWATIRDGLADLWDWWGEGVHLRPQPKLTGKRFDQLLPPYVQELIDWHIHQHRESGYVPWPPRTTTIDAVLGDALCRLTALVHHLLAVPANQEPDWDAAVHDEPPAKDLRRYQSWGRIAGRWEVRFRPSGPNPLFFQHYCARIRAAGPRYTPPFPSGLVLASTDFRSANLPVQVFSECDLRGADFQNATLFMSYFGGSRLNFARIEDANAWGAVFRGADLGFARLSRLEAEQGDFRNANLRNVDLSNARLNGATFDSARVDGINLQNASVSRAVLPAGLATAPGAEETAV